MTDMMDFISQDDLTTLRQSYTCQLMVGASKSKLARLHPGGAAYVAGVVDSLYTGAPVSHKDRERCLITLLAERGEPMTLGIHIYWGLMEGLSLEEIGHTLMLVGAYTGIPAYAAGLTALEASCKVMKAAVEAKTTDTASVLGLFVREMGV